MSRSRLPSRGFPSRALAVRTALGLALAAVATGAAFADPAALQRCRQEPDSLLRLRCYDAIPLPTPNQTGVAPTSAPQGAGAPAAAPSAAAAAIPAGAAAQFGLENRQQAQQVVDSIESYVPGRVDGWVANTRFKLANGQVWEIRDGSTAAYDLRDPKVRIVRGFSGSFFMELEGVSHTPRVRRVE